MHKKLGSFQGLRSYLFFLSFLILISPASWAATKFLIIAPGQSYSGSSAPNLGSPNSQVAGETFSLNLYIYDDSTYLPQPQGAQTSSLGVTTGSATFSPSVSFNFPESFAGVSACHRGTINPVTANLIPAASGNVGVTLATGGGIGGDTDTIYVQRITNFVVTKPGTITAGVPFAVTIEARDASQLCDAFHGSATLTAVGGGANGSDTSASSQGLGTINFTNGKYMGYVTLYYATSSADFRVNKSNSPAVNMLTGTFTINPNSFTKLLLLAPGETHYAGTLGGDGQSGTPSAQTAGVAYTMTAYGVDAYWNTVPSATGTVSLSSEDPTISGGGAIAFSSGVATFGSVVLHTVGDGNITVTANHSGAATADSTIVPLNPNSLGGFEFSNSFASSYTAGSNIALSIKGVDAWGNAVDTITGTTTMTVKYGTTTLSNTYESWAISPTFNSSAFSNGVYTGNLNIKRAASNYTVTISNTTSGVTDEVSSSFNVTANTAFWYLTVMPGQTYTPGERHSGTWGRTGTPNNVTAGNPVSINVYITDGYGNQVVTQSANLDWNPASHLDVTDALASSNPDPISISAGQGTAQITLTVATTNQNIHMPAGNPPFDQASGQFTVVNTTFDHLTVSAGATQTAGNQFTMSIRAKDQYENDVQSYSNTVYVTCPPLDYFGPTQSVIQINGATSNYTAGSSTANWRVPGASFSAGVANMGTRIYRATTATGTAYLFVSDIATDTPVSHTGHIGQTVGMTVNPNTYRTMFAIVPGLSYRPGADSSGNTYFAGVGYNGIPLTQQQGNAFSVTIYATDLYWNIRTDANDNFTTTTSPNTSDIHNVTNSLFNGLRQLDVTFNADSDYSITIDNPSPGVNTYVTPYTITSFTVNHFDLELVSGGAWPSQWVAGVPVNVSITAWSDATHVATTFNGTSDLSCTLDHSPTMKVIRPTSITFTNGVWNGQVTVFRANRTPTENNNITVSLGSTQNNSATIRICHNVPTKMLIVEEGGMELFNGLNPDVDPTGELSIQGQPAIQIAGSPITKIDFYLCDDYWNTVTTPAQDANKVITITCTDPFPAQILGVGQFSGGTLSVNLSNGVYQANNSFVLYKVNGSTGQQIGVNLGGYTTYVLGTNKNAVPVKHAAANLDIVSPYDSRTRRFNFIINTSQAAFSSGAAVAGAPFAVTVAAVDCYGNTLNSLNGGVAFGTYTSVNLSANTDISNKSMWPTKMGTLDATKWTEGISYPWIYVYKKVTGGGEFLTAAYDFGAGGRTGVSQNFNVLNNSFARVVAYTTGMSIPDDLGAGGTYVDPTGALYPSTPPPASVNVFNNFGNPSAETAGIHASALRAYTCDIYGNIVKGTPSFNVSLDTSDPYSPPPINKQVDNINGYADFTNTFRFHTKGTQTITFSPTTVTATDGTTPNITVNPGAYYGLQILVPGLTAVEGSGNSGLATGAVQGLPANSWYSGVSGLTGTTYEGNIEVEGIYFAVTVQAVDLFGNFVGSSAPTNSIELRSDDPNSGAEPNSGAFLNDTLSGGRAWFNAQLRSNGLRTLTPYDLTNGSIIDGAESKTVAYLQISQTGLFHYELVINGIRVSDNQTVLVEAHPSTFNVRVEVVHDTLHQIVSLTKQFVLDVYSSISPLTPASGNLSINTSQILNGVCDIPNETYDVAQTIYIRAHDLDAGDLYPVAPGYSPRIDVSASAPSRILMSSDPDNLVEGTTYQVEANHNVPIYAQVLDVNNNYVVDSPVTFDLTANGATTSTLSLTQTATNSTNGTAQTTFIARAENLQHTITAHAGSATGILTMNVTVTGEGGVYPNPFNPLLGQVAHIDYKLDEPADVKIEIYTLLGNLVWTKSIPSDQPGAKRGVNSVSWLGKNDSGVTIANGGYIVLVKVNGKERKRFKLGVYKGN